MVEVGFSDRDERAKTPIWAVVPSDCTLKGEKYVTSEFADVAQLPCGKPPQWTLTDQHFTSRI